MPLNKEKWEILNLFYTPTSYDEQGGLRPDTCLILLAQI